MMSDCPQLRSHISWKWDHFKIEIIIIIITLQVMAPSEDFSNGTKIKIRSRPSDVFLPYSLASSLTPPAFQRLSLREEVAMELHATRPDNMGLVNRASCSIFFHMGLIMTRTSLLQFYYMSYT